MGIKGKATSIRASESKEQLTLMMTICTNGEILSPLFIWHGKTVQIGEKENIPPEILISATSKEFMTGEIFAQWI